MANFFEGVSTRLYPLGNDIWVVDQEMVRSYIIVGEERAIILDAVANETDLHELISQVTDKPCELVFTHTDGDHTGNVKLFDRCYVHPSEEHVLRSAGYTGECIPLADGDVIELGGRAVEVMHIPGHTSGSLAFIDTRTRTLFSGDTVSYDAVFMFGPKRSVPDFLASLARLERERSRFDTIYPSHGLFPVATGAISLLTECMNGVLEGAIPPSPPGDNLPHGAEAHRYIKGCCSIYYN